MSLGVLRYEIKALLLLYVLSCILSHSGVVSLVNIARTLHIIIIYAVAFESLLSSVTLSRNGFFSERAISFNRISLVTLSAIR